MKKYIIGFIILLLPVCCYAEENIEMRLNNLEKRIEHIEQLYREAEIKAVYKYTEIQAQIRDLGNRIAIQEKK